MDSLDRTRACTNTVCGLTPTTETPANTQAEKYPIDVKDPELNDRVVYAPHIVRARWMLRCVACARG